MNKDMTTVEDVRDFVPRKQANGELPQARKQAVEQGLTLYHEMAAERDALTAEVARLKTEIASYKVMVEGHVAQQNEMQSRVNVATIVRDQAVADRAKYEALFIMMQAQLRAFAIPAAPLVTAAKEEIEITDKIEVAGSINQDDLERIRNEFAARHGG